VGTASGATGAAGAGGIATWAAISARTKDMAYHTPLTMLEKR